MDDRLRLFLCTLSGAGLFGLLGAVFGAAAGANVRAGGRVAGGALGLAAARALERVRGREFHPIAAGLVVGGIDGVAFLGVVGAVFGLVYGSVGERNREMMVNLAMAAGGLALGAAVMGSMASGLVRAGVWGIGVVFVAALGGGTLGVRLAGVPGLFYGATIGFGLGALAAIVRASARPAPSSDEEETKE